jgi:hypothetical protein
MGVRAILVLLALAGPVGAQEMTPETFEAFSEGRTLYFTFNGAPFGAEQYFPGRRSLWRFADGVCEEGDWWGEAERICFRYGEDGLPQCWRFRQNAGGLAAALVEGGAETGFVLEMSGVDDTPLPCPGPRVAS